MMKHLLCALAIAAAGCSESKSTHDNTELLGSKDYVITLDGTRTTATVAAAIKSLGPRVHAFSHLPLVLTRLSSTQISLVRTLPGVRGVYENKPLQPLLAQSIGTINADDVHAIGFNGAGVGVAVLDSGVDGTHADLAYPNKTVQNVKIVASA